jgi:hypothetical protein
MAPYPTLGDASRRAAGAFFAPRLLGVRTKRLVRWLARFGRSLKFTLLHVFLT